MQYLIILIISLVLNINHDHLQSNSENTITVTISNLNSNEGNVFVGLYDSETHFLNKSLKSIATKIENNSCEIVFKNIPNGTYAISMYHDENGNNKMDKGMFGIPKEDYGCSNNAKGFMGPPKWEDARFEVKGKSVNQHIKL